MPTPGTLTNALNCVFVPGGIDFTWSGWDYDTANGLIYGVQFNPLAGEGAVVQITLAGTTISVTSQRTDTAPINIVGPIAVLVDPIDGTVLIAGGGTSVKFNYLTSTVLATASGNIVPANFVNMRNGVNPKTESYLATVSGSQNIYSAKTLALISSTNTSGYGSGTFGTNEVVWDWATHLLGAGGGAGSSLQTASYDMNNVSPSGFTLLIDGAASGNFTDWLNSGLSLIPGSPFALANQQGAGFVDFFTFPGMVLTKHLATAYEWAVTDGSVAYCVNGTTLQCDMYSMATGAFIGTLGTFGLTSGTNLDGGIGFVKHPQFGNWLFMHANGHVQGMFISASNPCVVTDPQGDILSSFVSDLGLNIGVATQLYKNFVPPANIVVSESNSEGRTAVVLDFDAGDGLYSRDIETAFTWGIGNNLVLRKWQPSLIEMPEEQFNRPSDWDDGGNPGAKFIQGIIIEADSFANPKTFQLQSADDLSLHALNEVPATFPKQTTIAFSCVTPFISHTVRVVATDDVAWRVWKSNLVFQPWPEETTNWQGEQTSLGMKGWLHSREMNIGYASANPITIVLTFDSWPSITLTLPSSGGALVKAKTKLTLPANKFKLVAPQVSSSAPFFLFKEDLEFKVKEWGSTDPYRIEKFLGGATREGADV